MRFAMFLAAFALLSALLSPLAQAALPPIGETPFGPIGPWGAAGICIAYNPPDDLQYQTTGTCGTGLFVVSASPERGVHVGLWCHLGHKLCIHFSIHSGGVTDSILLVRAD